MKSLNKTFAVAVLAAGLFGSGAALAWGGHGGAHCDGPGAHRGAMGGGKAGWSQLAPEQIQARMAERLELRMARLELALALKPEQQAAFAGFKARMSERAAKQAQAMAAAGGEQAPKTAVARMERMEQMHAERARALAESRETVSSFYAQLSDAQKTVFDAEFQRMDHRGWHGGWHGGRSAEGGKGGKMGGEGRGQGPRAEGHRG